MKLIGLCVVRNEAWVLPASLRAALQWVDKLAVLYHCCTDNSPNIINDASMDNECRILMRPAYGGEWDEAEYRSELLEWGRDLGGTHFAVIDADEILTAPAVPVIRHEAGQLEPGELLKLPWIHCWRGLGQYRCDDSPFGTARVPFLFRDAPHLTYAPDPDGYQLHKRVPAQCKVLEPPWSRDMGEGVLHLQHANWARVVAKQARYAVDEKRRWGSVRANYAAATDETGLELKPIPPEWWPVDPVLVDLEAVAWQAQQEIWDKREEEDEQTFRETGIHPDQR